MPSCLTLINSLLTKSLNPAISNGPWESKRREILKHSAIHLNRVFFEYETWDEEAILKRTKMLMSQALKIWPHPGGHSKKKME